MGLIMFIILGAIVGVVVGMGMPHAPGGTLLTAVIGLVGGLIGGIGLGAVGGMDPLAQFFSLWGWVGAILGAILVLAVYALIASPKVGPGDAQGPEHGSPASGDRTTGR